MILMKYNVVNLILKTDSKLTASPAKVRGFLGNTYKDFPLQESKEKFPC